MGTAPDAAANERARLHQLLAERSYQQRRVTLASGRESDFYFDSKQTVLDAEGADLTALTDDGWSALAIARGLSYTDFYKAQVHTAARLEQLMQARGLDTEMP